MASETGYDSYDPAFFDLLYEVESRHFWFRARNSIIAALVKRLTSELATGFRVLEVGCGTGNVLCVLDHICPNGIVVGMDLFSEGLRYAQQRTSAVLVQADVHQPPFVDAFDLVGLFDVLEHLLDDEQVLHSLGGMLRENGRLLLTVPAHTGLWSYFDEASHHCRRYEPEELKHKLVEAGYDVEYVTQYMMSIFPFVWVGRRLSSFRRRASTTEAGTSSEELATRELRPIPILNEVLLWLLHLEGRWLSHGRTLPLGTSLLAVARKRG